PLQASTYGRCRYSRSQTLSSSGVGGERVAWAVLAKWAVGRVSVRTRNIRSVVSTSWWQVAGLNARRALAALGSKWKGALLRRARRHTDGHTGSRKRLGG